MYLKKLKHLIIWKRENIKYEAPFDYLYPKNRQKSDTLAFKTRL
jgi:hypothetical protein